MSLNFNGCGKIVRKEEKQSSNNSEQKNKQIVAIISFQEKILMQPVFDIYFIISRIFFLFFESIFIDRLKNVANVLQKLFLISNKLKTKFTIFQIY